MSLTFVGDSNPIAGTTSATADSGAISGPGTPLAVDDHVFLHVTNKRPAVTPSTPAGWSLVGSSVQVGGGTAGAGGGPLRITVFYRRWQSGDSVPAIANSGTGAVIQCALVVYRGALGDSLSFATSSGSDTTDATSWSVTGGSTIAFAVDDVLLTFAAVTSTGPNFSAPSVTASEITFDTLGNPYSSSTGSGDDQRAACYRTVVTAGSGTVAPSMTDTLTASGIATGGALFVRVRQTPPVTHAKTGSGAAKGAGSGPKELAAQAPIEKASGGAAGSAAAGAREVAHPAPITKSAAAAVVGVGTGLRQRDMPRAGAGAVVAAGSGAAVVVLTVIEKAGSAAPHAAGTGVRQRERPRSGAAAARTAGAGTGATVHAVTISKTGSAAVRGAGTGLRNVELSRTGSGGLFRIGSGALSLIHI